MISKAKKVLLSVFITLFVVSFVSSTLVADDASAGKININKASLVELEGLKGIGKKKALAILEYREKNGGFKNIEELIQIKGIGGKIFESIAAIITVGDEVEKKSGSE